MTNIDKIVIITQKTFLDELIEKYNTKEQAKFYIEHSGGSFDEYYHQDKIYYNQLSKLKKQLPSTIRYQVVDKSYLPNFLFGSNDLIIVFGRDGLVINTAKYLDGQVILGVNPDPDRIDGILLKFTVEQVRQNITKILDGELDVGAITLVEAELNNGQKIIGVNDLFIGHKTHKSARYTIEFNERSEVHSSSGIIVSTGIGSTGWLSSIISNVVNMSKQLGFDPSPNLPKTTFQWNSNRLVFAVREAWLSSTTQNTLIYGEINKYSEFKITSHMSEGGVIFSDGMIEDSVRFTSGSIATIRICNKKAYYYK